MKPLLPVLRRIRQPIYDTEEISVAQPWYVVPRFFKRLILFLCWLSWIAPVSRLVNWLARTKEAMMRAEGGLLFFRDRMLYRPWRSRAPLPMPARIKKCPVCGGAGIGHLHRNSCLRP